MTPRYPFYLSWDRYAGAFADPLGSSVRNNGITRNGTTWDNTITLVERVMNADRFKSMRVCCRP